MTKEFRNITFPPENDGFFTELREEVNAYFKNNGKSIYGNTSMYLKIAGLVIVYMFFQFHLFFRLNQYTFFYVIPF